MELYGLTAHELHDLLIRKEVSAREVTASVLQRMEQVEGRVHAFITTSLQTAAVE